MYTLFCNVSSLRAQDIVNVIDINNAGSSIPHDLIISNDKLFFIAQDASNYKSLWVTLGTNATTSNVGPFGGISNSLQELQSYNNKIYFSKCSLSNQYKEVPMVPTVSTLRQTEVNFKWSVTLHL